MTRNHKSPPGRAIGEAAGAAIEEDARLSREVHVPRQQLTPFQVETSDGAQLTVFLNPELDIESVPQVMEEVLGELSKMFPEQDITVTAYVLWQPPVKVGTAHFDVATGERTFTWDLPEPDEERPFNDSRQKVLRI